MNYLKLFLISASLLLAPTARAADGDDITLRQPAVQQLQVTQPEKQTDSVWKKRLAAATVIASAILIGFRVKDMITIVRSPTIPNDNQSKTLRILSHLCLAVVTGYIGFKAVQDYNLES